MKKVFGFLMALCLMFSLVTTISAEMSATQVSNADELVEALEKGEDVIFTNDIKIDPANMSNAYGTTGINVKYGQTIDGAGYTLDIKGAGGTWDSGISTTGGVIKNITITGSFRGVFVNHNSTYSETVVLDNVTIDGTIYTISCDQGMGQNLVATNCTFNGWTSYASTIGTVEFVDCTFGEGNGYAYMRPYAKTTYVDCTFEKDYKVEPVSEVTLTNCNLNGTLLTEENYNNLVVDNASNVIIDDADAKIEDRSYASLNAAIDAAEEGDTVTLLKDITVDTKFSVNKNITLDLNDNTLTLTKTDNDVTGLNDVVIENGTIALEPTNNAGDGIIRIGARNKDGGSLFLQNVTVTGDDISSGAGTVMIYSNGAFTMNNSVLDLSDEKCSAAYMIYSNDGTKANVVINKSKILGDNVNSGIFNGNVEIIDSEITMNVKDNGINGGKDSQVVSIKNSDVTLTGGKGRALTFYGDNTVTIENSHLSFKDFEEADIRYKTFGENQLIIKDVVSTVTFGTYVVDGNSEAKVEDLLDTFDLPTCGLFEVSEGTISVVYNHKITVINKKEATCTEKGYTGDEYCETCEQIITEGEDIKKLGHKITVINKKDATCTEEGYTGDEYCETCEKTLVKGNVVKATGHTFKDGKCTVCNEKEKTPETGDATNVASLITMLLASGYVLSRKRA